MTYDETGGCGLLAGYFCGECPIHETGRQSHCTLKQYVFCVFCLSCIECGNCQIYAQVMFITNLGLIIGTYETPGTVYSKLPLSCMAIRLNIYSIITYCRRN